MKTFRPFHLLIALLAFGLLGFSASRASADTAITSAPYTITVSGHYYLTGNLNNSTFSPAIWVQAPNVTIDLNGFYVAGPGDPSMGGNNGYSTVYVGEVANVTIKNGTLAGAAYGIVYSANNAANLRNYVVENVTITRCYLFGILCYNAAPGSLIKNCSFSTIGNSTFSTFTTPAAIDVHGGFVVQGNNIGDVTSNGNNLTTGIVATASDFSLNNTIANCKTGISGGKYLNNLTYNVTTPFNGGTAATGNN